MTRARSSSTSSSSSSSASRVRAPEPRAGGGKPLILAALGARGTGKSAWVQQQLDKVLRPSRLAVWDLMQEYPAEGTASLGDAIRAMRRARFRVAFYPSRDDKVRARQFDLWCDAVMQAGNCTAVVEELAFVTRPSWAPRGWREMVLLGRHAKHRVSIIGTSQRPAQVDKEFFGNADLVHCGRLAYATDAKVIADLMAVRAVELQQLPDLDYFERAAGACSASRGRLVFSTAPRSSSSSRPAPLAPGAKDQPARPPQASGTLGTFDLAQLAGERRPTTEEPDQWTPKP